MMGRQHQRSKGGGWVYSPLPEAMAEARLQELETYIFRLQNTVAQFIDTRPIMELFLAAEKCLGSQVTKQWWEQGGLYLEMIQTSNQEADWTEGGGRRRMGWCWRRTK